MKTNISQPLPKRFWRLFSLGALTLMVALGTDRPAAMSGGAGQRQAPSRQEGQRPEGSQRLPWWKDPATVKELGLSAEQSAQIDAVWKKREEDMRGPSTELKKHREELNRMLAERKVGLDVISVQVDRVEAQRTTLEKSRVLMLYQFSLILTPEQNKALQAYFERSRRGRGDSRRY